MVKYRLKLSYNVAPAAGYTDVSHHDSMAGALAHAAKRDREHRPCAEQPHSFFAVEISEVEV